VKVSGESHAPAVLPLGKGSIEQEAGWTPEDRRKILSANMKYLRPPKYSLGEYLKTALF
jgi:hypothetical protein